MTHLQYLEGYSESGKTKKIIISSKHDNSILGVVQWSGGWRQYVFVPIIEYETQWSFDCLEEISNYVKRLNKEKKEDATKHRIQS